MQRKWRNAWSWSSNNQREDKPGKNSIGFAYSDRINHAFAYAAVHHRDKKRKGTRVPYITHPANVALILARYGCDDDTIIAGILHDVVEDCKDHSREEHCRAIEAKFGAKVLRDVLTVTKPELSGDGQPLTSVQKKAGYLDQVASGSPNAMRVCAADKIHNARCIISDLERSPDNHSFVWKRFKGTKEDAARFYVLVFLTLKDRGFDEPIMRELSAAASMLNDIAARPERRRLTTGYAEAVPWKRVTLVYSPPEEWPAPARLALPSASGTQETPRGEGNVVCEPTPVLAGSVQSVVLRIVSTYAGTVGEIWRDGKWWRTKTPIS